MTNWLNSGLDARRQVRMRTADMREFDHQCRAMGIAPGTMHRHLALAWLQQRKAQQVAQRAEHAAGAPPSPPVESQGENL